MTANIDVTTAQGKKEIICRVIPPRFDLRIEIHVGEDNLDYTNYLVLRKN